jgi:hypothetical protein
MALFSLIQPLVRRFSEGVQVEPEALQALLVWYERQGLSGIAARDAACRDLLLGASLWGGLEGYLLGRGNNTLLPLRLLASLRTQTRLVQSIAWLYQDETGDIEVLWRFLSKYALGRSAILGSSTLLSQPTARDVLQKTLERMFPKLPSELILSRLPVLTSLAELISQGQSVSRLGEEARSHFRKHYLRHISPQNPSST